MLLIWNKTLHKTSYKTVCEVNGATGPRFVLFEKGKKAEKKKHRSSCRDLVLYVGGGNVLTPDMEIKSTHTHWEEKNNNSKPTEHIQLFENLSSLRHDLASTWTIKTKDSDEESWYMMQVMRGEKSPEKWTNRVLQSQFSAHSSSFWHRVEKAVLNSSVWRRPSWGGKGGAGGQTNTQKKTQLVTQEGDQLASVNGLVGSSLVESSRLKPAAGTAGSHNRPGGEGTPWRWGRGPDPVWSGPTPLRDSWGGESARTCQTRVVCLCVCV